MSMIPMLDVVPEIIVDIHSCPNPIAIRALRDTMMDFCRHSEAWVIRDNFGTTIADQPKVALNLPDHTRLVRVISMNHGGIPLTPASEQMLDNIIYDWRNHTGDPVSFIEYSGSEVVVYPVPNRTATADLQGTLAIAPTRTATEINEQLWDEWLEGLTAGAQARLMMMPDKPWTNPQAALLLASRFEEAITLARRYSRGDHQGKHRTTRYGGY